MLIKNLNKDYVTITGGVVKQGETTAIADWELPLIKALGQEIEVIDDHLAEASKKVETPKLVKKKKK